MAVEDGAALGVLLSQIQSRDEIPARLQLFQQLRLDRVSAMIVLSSVGQDESAKIAEAAKPYVKGPVPSEFPALSLPSPRHGLWKAFGKPRRPETRPLLSGPEFGNKLTVFSLLRTGTPEEYHVHNFTPNVVRDAMELLEKHKVGKGQY